MKSSGTNTLILILFISVFVVLRRPNQTITEITDIAISITELTKLHDLTEKPMLTIPLITN